MHTRQLLQPQGTGGLQHIAQYTVIPLWVTGSPNNTVSSANVFGAPESDLVPGTQ